MINDKVAILLATYQGEAFLAAQLDSLISQTHKNWKIWASDDGSTDNTQEILFRYKEKLPEGKFSILFGPKKGYAVNFISILCKEFVDADYFAYCDQDDIWDSQKLARAVEWLNIIPSDSPALYCSRSRLVTFDGFEFGFSPLFLKRPSFANALIQNIGGGNTMVMNNAARLLLKEAGENIFLVSHDWWTYLLVTGCGGIVFYDAKPNLQYRQHNKNLIGTNSSFFARIKRINMLFKGVFTTWNTSNIAALRSMNHRLTQANLKTLKYFENAREFSLIPRLLNLKLSGVYRQTFWGNIALFIAAVLKKL